MPSEILISHCHIFLHWVISNLSLIKTLSSLWSLLFLKPLLFLASLGVIINVVIFSGYCHFFCSLSFPKSLMSLYFLFWLVLLLSWMILRYVRSTIRAKLNCRKILFPDKGKCILMKTNNCSRSYWYFCQTKLPILKYISLQVK